MIGSRDTLLFIEGSGIHFCFSVCKSTDVRN